MGWAQGAAVSIQITVRHSDGTQQNQTLNNGDGEIDTKTEAEDALAFAAKDGDTVDVGGKSYTRQQLIDIRDGKSGTAPKSSDDKFVDFSMIGGPRMGKWGHGTGALEGSYGKLVKDGEKADVWAKIGGKIGGGLWNFETPGGEAATSAFYAAGLNGGVGVDFNPKGGKAHINLGAEGSVSGFTSPKSVVVSLPLTCTPGEFGQGECEPNAGPTEGDAGISGIYNPDAHNSVHGAGVAVSGALKASVGFEVSDNARVNFSVAPTATYLADRHPFGFNGVDFGLGVTYVTGKTTIPTPLASNPVVTSDGQTVDQTGTTIAPNAAFDATSLIASLGLPPGTTPTRLEMTDGRGTVEASSSIPPASIPADKMTAGDHTLRIYYSLPGGAGEKYREVKIRIGAAPIVVQPTDNGSAYGLVLDMPATASRPAPDMVAGVATQRPIPLGNIQTLATFPDGAKYQLYVDGNPVGTLADLPKDRRTDLSLPPTVGDGLHQVELRISRPGQPEVRFPARAVTVGPATTTLTAARVSSTTPGDGSYTKSPVRIEVTSSKAGKARVTVGNYTEDVTLTAGVNSITLTGEPRNWNTGSRAGAKASYTIKIQPLSSTNQLEGTSIDVGSVPIKRAGGSGGGGGGSGWKM